MRKVFGSLFLSRRSSPSLSSLRPAINLHLRQTCCYSTSLSDFVNTNCVPPKESILAKRDVNGIWFNTISDNPGSKKKSRKKGRGYGSSKGKTAGRGHKGQKARSSIRPGFEGGQNPMSKRVRKYGRPVYKFRRRYASVNLDKLQYYIEYGKIDPKQKIDMKVLVDSKILRFPSNKTNYEGIKLLGNGKEWFKVPNLEIEVSKCSKEVKDTIERYGGKVRQVYYHKLHLRKCFRSGTPLGPPQKYILGRENLASFKSLQATRRKLFGNEKARELGAWNYKEEEAAEEQELLALESKEQDTPQVPS